MSERKSEKLSDLLITWSKTRNNEDGLLVKKEMENFIADLLKSRIPSRLFELGKLYGTDVFHGTASARMNARSKVIKEDDKGLIVEFKRNPVVEDMIQSLSPFIRTLVQDVLTVRLATCWKISNILKSNKSKEEIEARETLKSIMVVLEKIEEYLAEISTMFSKYHEARGRALIMFGESGIPDELHLINDLDDQMGINLKSCLGHLIMFYTSLKSVISQACDQMSALDKSFARVGLQ